MMFKCSLVVFNRCVLRVGLVGLRRLHFARPGGHTRWLVQTVEGADFRRPQTRAFTWPRAASFKERQATLGAIYESVAKMHNAAGITSPVDPGLQSFHDRLYPVLNSYRFVEATRNAIADESLRSMPLRGCI